MKGLILATSGLVLVCVLSLFGVWLRLTAYLDEPGPGGEERVVLVGEGVGGMGVVTLFDREHLVRRPDWLRFFVERLAKPIEIKPGEYRLSGTMTPNALLEHLSSGEVVTYPIEIPPGVTAAEIVRILAKEKLADEAQLAELVEDARFAEELTVPNVSLEGFLFPDKYDLPRGLGAKALLGVLVGRYKRFVTSGILEAARANGLEERELIILASLIERSRVKASEQRVFSAMLHNRLKKSLPLGLRASLDYGLARKGLTEQTATPTDKKTRWNTGDNPGLPPGPIASPSLSAIVAAAEPARSDALYAVVKSDGSHVFCPDLECEEAALKESSRRGRAESARR